MLPLSFVSAQELSSAEREIIKLENAWNTAWQKGDGAFLEQLLATDYLDTGFDGITYTKAQNVANATSAVYRPKSFSLTDLRVRLYHDTAVVTGRNSIKAILKGNDTTAAYLFTDVYVKQNSRWQLVATQETRIPEK